MTMLTEPILSTGSSGTAIPRPGPPLPRPSSVTLRPLLRAVRPLQQIKNVLCIAAPMAAGLITRGATSLWALLAVGSFMSASASTYLINDLRDVDTDRLHPTKRNRPIAAGELREDVAKVSAFVFFGVAVGLPLAFDKPGLMLVVAIYACLTLAYSMGLKHIAIVDMMVVAAGFLLRIAAGGAATDVKISRWFFMVTAFGAMYVVSGKRRGEMARKDNGSGRKVLDQYTPEFLSALTGSMLAAAVISYSLWAVERSTLARIPWFELSIVPFVGAALRHALLSDTQSCDEPERLFVEDRVLILFVLTWTLLVTAGVYVHL
jgi:decaprenyl-phosphate phosphoribosyltransferase